MCTPEPTALVRVSGRIVLENDVEHRQSHAHDPRQAPRIERELESGGDGRPADGQGRTACCSQQGATISWFKARLWLCRPAQVKLSEHGILPRECHKVKEDTGTGTAGEKGHTCGNAHFVNCSKPQGRIV